MQAFSITLHKNVYTFHLKWILWIKFIYRHSKLINRNCPDWRRKKKTYSISKKKVVSTKVFWCVLISLKRNHYALCERKKNAKNYTVAIIKNISSLLFELSQPLDCHKKKTNSTPFVLLTSLSSFWNRANEKHTKNYRD